jgi:hypothetical protein
MGTCDLDVKGETTSGGPVRVRVPKRGAGTDQPVVAMKSGNADRAKGLSYSVLSIGQPAMGGAGG